MKNLRMKCRITRRPTKSCRGKYAERYARGTNLVLLDPDDAQVFPNAEAVNSALRAIAGIIEERTQAPAA